MVTLSESELTLAVYRRSDYVTALEAELDGALYRVPSSWTFGNYTGLADLEAVVSTISECFCGENDQLTVAVYHPENDQWFTLPDYLELLEETL